MQKKAALGFALPSLFLAASFAGGTAPAASQAAGQFEIRNGLFPSDWRVYSKAERRKFAEAWAIRNTECFRRGPHDWKFPVKWVVRQSEADPGNTLTISDYAASLEAKAERGNHRRDRTFSAGGQSFTYKQGGEFGGGGLSWERPDGDRVRLVKRDVTKVVQLKNATFLVVGYQHVTHPTGYGEILRLYAAPGLPPYVEDILDTTSKPIAAALPSGTEMLVSTSGKAWIVSDKGSVRELGKYNDIVHYINSITLDRQGDIYFGSTPYVVKTSREASVLKLTWWGPAQIQLPECGE